MYEVEKVQNLSGKIIWRFTRGIHREDDSYDYRDWNKLTIACAFLEHIKKNQIEKPTIGRNLRGALTHLQSMASAALDSPKTKRNKDNAL